MSCNILASLSLDPKKSWFYIGCTTCFTKAAHYFNPETEEIETDKYSCQKCGKQITTTQPRFFTFFTFVHMLLFFSNLMYIFMNHLYSCRFKLHIKATDNTGSASFILFDDIVIPLIKKSAYELLEQQVQVLLFPQLL